MLLQPSWGGRSHISWLQDRAQPMASHPSWGPALPRSRGALGTYHGVPVLAPVMLQLGGSSVHGSTSIRPILPMSTRGYSGGLPCACEQGCPVLDRHEPFLGAITHCMSSPSDTGHWAAGGDGHWGGFGLPCVATSGCGDEGLCCSLSSTLPCLRVALAGG